MLWFPKSVRKIKTDMGNVWACVPYTGASIHMLTCFNLPQMSKVGIYLYIIKIVIKSVILSCTPCILSHCTRYLLALPVAFLNVEEPFWRPWLIHRAWPLLVAVSKTPASPKLTLEVIYLCCCETTDSLINVILEMRFCVELTKVEMESLHNHE